MKLPQEVLLAEPRGFCAGVDRAIEIVERALAKFGAPIYVRHEIVHNTYVVNDLKAKGAIFIEELSDVPPGATLIFSAHGVSKAVQEEAKARGFHIFDATCPLVSKVHVEVAKLAQEGYEFIMIGHKGHPEVEGTLGQLDGGIHLVEDVADVARVQPAQQEKLAVVTQTTLSVDDAAEIMAAVRARFPQVREPKQQDICYATQNRQDAIKLMRSAGGRSDWAHQGPGRGVGPHTQRHSGVHQVPAAQGPAHGRCGACGWRRGLDTIVLIASIAYGVSARACFYLKFCLFRSTDPAAGPPPPRAGCRCAR